MKSYPQFSQNNASAAAGSEQLGHACPDGAGAEGASGTTTGAPLVPASGAAAAGAGVAAGMGTPQTSQ
ncbi:hypothetical protein [Kribbella sp. HUAS MG21]|uniref:Uncharacterized protein n=1 Tax=Kribbella sp. HUAS MG21 TaxID=3160966 RepID=A0AAU7TN96_9ACTN